MAFNVKLPGGVFREPLISPPPIPEKPDRPEPKRLGRDVITGDE